MADKQTAAEKLNRELSKATTMTEVNLVSAKADALAKIQELKK